MSDALKVTISLVVLLVFHFSPAGAEEEIERQHQISTNSEGLKEHKDEPPANAMKSTDKPKRNEGVEWNSNNSTETRPSENQEESTVEQAQLIQNDTTEHFQIKRTQNNTVSTTTTTFQTNKNNAVLKLNDSIVNSTQTKNNTQSRSQNNAEMKRQKIVQAQQLSNILQSSNHRGIELNQLLKQINRTDEGKEQLRTLQQILNKSIQAWEEKQGAVNNISQQEQLPRYYQSQLQRILNLQTQTPDRQRNLLNLLNAPPQARNRGNELNNRRQSESQLLHLLAQVAETQEGESHLKELRAVLKEGVASQWEVQRAQIIVNKLVSQDSNLGVLQRKQLQMTLLQQVRSLQGQRILETVLDELNE